jgi:SAM-dependent methyltransferase
VDEPRASFARDPATAAYYDRRAGEYDEWYLGAGQFTGPRPGWDSEVAAVVAALAGLPPATTLDVACGTGFLTRHLPGRVLAVDRSPAMAAIARSRVRVGWVAVADGLRLPVRAGAVQRVVTGHFYGHLPEEERTALLAEVRRLDAELVVVDSALRAGVAAEGWSERTLNDGSRHRVFKRYLTGPGLAGEIGGEVLFAGRWFVAVRSGTRS